MLELESIQQKGFHNLYNEDGEAIGFQVCFRIVNYRSPWLSEFRFGNVTVDGERFGEDKCTFIIGGVEYTYAEMLTLGDVHWPLKEAVAVHVQKPGGLAQGSHTVSILYKTVSSYLPPRADELPAEAPEDAKVDRGHPEARGYKREMLIV